MKKRYAVRTIIFAGSLLLQLSPLCFHSRGAPGDLDLSFDPGFGANGSVNAVVVQPDGKVLIGGYFNTVKGLVRPGLARLNADGSGDATFNAGAIPGGIISIVLQPDGKVLVGYGYGITRFNSDGSPDTNFINPSITDDNFISAGGGPIAVQSDGKVLIGGHFTRVNGTNRNGIARLNANGSLDGSFNPGTGANGRFFGRVAIGWKSAHRRRLPYGRWHEPIRDCPA